MPIIEDNVSKFVVQDESENFYNFNSTAFVPSRYIAAQMEQWRNVDYDEGITSKELLHYAEQSKSFDFLKEPDEDIYGMHDGEPI